MIKLHVMHGYIYINLSGALKFIDERNNQGYRCYD